MPHLQYTVRLKGAELSDSSLLVAWQLIGPRRSHLRTPVMVTVLDRSSCPPAEDDTLSFDSLNPGLVGGASAAAETTGNVGTDLFQRDPLTIRDEALGSVGPGELEEGAFGGAGQNHGAVVLDGLGQVGLDGHLRNRFCSQREEEPQRSVNSLKMWAEPGAARRPRASSSETELQNQHSDAE